jgi:dimethylamine/trimethylamine dehydrogenase
MGEEWRRGWHPEAIPPKGSDARILVIGGGPAGLECARAAGQRGYAVTLAEADGELGGRINRDSRLPGLATWARVRDWRLGRLHALPNVELYPGSRLSAGDVAAFEADHVVCATGASWRRDGLGAATPFGVPGLAGALTADDLLRDGIEPEGRVLIYDDDHYYMGSALAELLAGRGQGVTYATPAPVVSAWTAMTNEQHFIQSRLVAQGVRIVTGRRLEAAAAGGARLAGVYGEAAIEVPCDSLVLVTARQSDDALYRELAALGTRNLHRIGDCEAPGAIAHAVHAGHRLARELDAEVDPDLPFRRERVVG